MFEVSLNLISFFARETKGAARRWAQLSDKQKAHPRAEARHDATNLNAAPSSRRPTLAHRTRWA